MADLIPRYLTLPLTTSIKRLAIGRRNFFRSYLNHFRYDFFPGCPVSYSCPTVVNRTHGMGFRRLS